MNDTNEAPRPTSNNARSSAADAPSVAGVSRKRSKRRWLVAAVALVALLGWLAFDLFAPRRTRLRDFDPAEVGRLETAMWRSYYERRRLALFNQLAELLRTQYRLPFARSNAVAFRAARAAFVFKDGRGRADYERALPDLVKFYTEIREVGDVPFSPERAARLELEWWIVHRERRRHQPGDLERSLAELAAEVYGVPAGRLAEHAALRAEAMRIRDTKAEAGGVTEEDWRRIDELLQACWRSLWQAVN